MADPMPVDDQRALANVRRAETDDLLNRVTVFRAGMDAHMIRIIEGELRSRNVGPQEIEAHAQKLAAEVIFLEDSCAARCSFCHQPAVAHGWGWHWLWGKIPLFPRLCYFCKEHR